MPTNPKGFYKDQLGKDPQTLQLLANAMFDLVFVVSGNRITEIFGEILHDWKLKAADLVDKTVKQALGKPAFDQFKLNFPTAQNPQLEYNWFIKINDRVYYFESTIILTTLGDRELLVVVSKDISKQISAEQRLAKNAETTDQILDTITDGFATFNTNWQFTYINRQAELVWQRTRQDLLSKNVWTEFPGSVGGEAYQKYHEVMKSRKPLSFETLSAGKRWYHIRVYPINDGIAIYFQDISDQKSTNADNEKLTTERFALLESIGEGVYGVDRAGICTFINRRGANMLGYASEDLIGKDMHKLIHHHHQETADCPIDQSFITGKVQRVMNDNVWRADGSSVVVDYSASPIKLDNKIIGSVIAFRDVTERNRQETELRESREQLEIVFQNVADGISVQDATGKLVFVNNVAAERAGFRNAEEMLSASITDLRKRIKDFEVRDENGQPFPQDQFPGRRALAGEKNPQAIVQYINNKTGQSYWANVKAKAVYNKNKEIIFCVNIFSDITQQKELEKRKDEFLSIASHELKTPITTVKAFAQLLGSQVDNTKDAKLKNYLGRIDHQIDRLTNLVQDLLDVSKIQSGKLVYQLKDFHFGKLVQELVQDIQTTTDHKLVLQGKCNYKVTGDIYRIGQVITNLINNAVKYSPHADKVIITLGYNRGQAEFAVQDFGVGIPQSHHQKIFERFYRVEDEVRGGFSGLGLGLYISAEIIKYHQGKLWFESSEDQGSTFHFQVPVKKGLFL